MSNVSVAKIADAINKSYAITINYKSDGKEDAVGDRYIQPVAYGLTKKGYPVIRAFQPYGDTLTKNPAWKFFRVDRIINWVENKDENFSEPPGTYSAEGIFNRDGDETMSIVYIVANFTDNNLSKNVIDKVGPIKKDDIFKTDTEMGIEKLRQQLQNPRTIKLDSVKDGNRNDDIKQINNTPDIETSNGPIVKSDINNTDDDIFKTDTEMGIEKLRQQLQNPKKLSDELMKNLK